MKSRIFTMLENDNDYTFLGKYYLKNESNINKFICYHFIVMKNVLYHNELIKQKYYI